MPVSPSFRVQLAQNVALLAGLVTLYGLVIRRWPAADPRAQTTAGLLFGAATLLGMHVPLPVLPGVFYDARSVVLTCAGVVLPGPGAWLAGVITAAGRLALGGAGAWVGASVAVTSVGAGALLRRVRARHPAWQGWRGWLAVGLFSHGLLVLTQLALPAAATALFLSQVLVPLLLVFVPATAALGVLLDLLEREHLNSAIVVAALSGSAEPVAVLLRGRWWINRAFSARLGSAGGRPEAEVARTLDAMAPHAQLPELEVTTPVGPKVFEARCLPALADSGLLLGRIFLLRDRSAERAAQARARYVERHDPLTDLPNRAALLDHIRRSAARDGALLLVDLPDLRGVNGRRGRAAGDRVLQALARRLDALAPPEAHAARILGSEFAVWCPGERGLVRAERVARGLQAEPLRLEGLGAHPVAVELGLARFDGALEPKALITRGRQAMLWGRERPRAATDPLPWYSPEIGLEVDQRLQILQALPDAMTADQLRLVFQPVVRLSDGALVGCEALLRWRHPTLGEVSPARFVPLAEQAGLMQALGGWVVEAALEAAQRWARHPGLTVAVNLSAVQLGQPDFGAQLAKRLRRLGLPPGGVELELTETAVLDHDRPAVRANLDALRLGGLGLVIDDFGTGYSSLLTLQRLDVRKLKIPREFVAGLPDSRSDLEIVRATLRLGQALGLTVQAEGIETEAQAALLRELGCPLAQGYLFDRPLEADAFEARVKAAGLRTRAGSPRT